MGEQTQFNSWALVELFGRQRISGLVSEQQVAGAGFVRVDVPAVNGIPGYTKLYYPSAIYGITPCGEQEAKRAAEYLHERPIQPYMVGLPAPVGAELDDGTEEDGDDSID